MRHQDLGVRDGTLLLFGGCYSNLGATQAVLAEARARGIAADHLICTGDVVAYCAAAAETCAAVMAAGAVVVAGNCEVQLAADAEDCGCGFEAGTTCDLLSAGWYPYARARISAAQRSWMADLPDIVSFFHHGKRYAVIHGGATAVARFIWPEDPEDVFAEEWQAVEAAIGPVDAIIAGHCGIAFERQTRRGPWINAGVIGMPPHDGQPATRYGLLRSGQVEIATLAYDAEAEAARMRAAGLRQGYERSLITGYWPSEDVLPEALHVPSAARG